MSYSKDMNTYYILIHTNSILYEKKLLYNYVKQELN